MIPFDVQDTESQPGGSTLLDSILRRLRQTLGSLAKAVTNDHLVAVVFPSASTDVQVRHGLRGSVLTWEVVDATAEVNVWRSPTVNGNPGEFLILQASAAARVLIRVS